MLDRPKMDPALLARFAAIVGEKYAITDPDMQAPYLVELRDMFRGRTPMVLRPATAAEVAEILKLANATATPVVPQGGNTGLVGGQIPHHNEIVLSLNRLDHIREVDPTTLLLTGLTRDGVYLVEDGEVAAAVNNFRFNESPLDLLRRASQAGVSEPTLPREWGDWVTRTAMPSLRIPDFHMSSVSQAT